LLKSNALSNQYPIKLNGLELESKDMDLDNYAFDLTIGFFFSPFITRLNYLPLLGHSKVAVQSL